MIRLSQAVFLFMPNANENPFFGLAMGSQQGVVANWVNVAG
jgi:hypothetical protein